MNQNLLSTNIKFLRSRLKLSQAKFSEKIEVEQKRYAKWEEGRCQPDIDNLIALARIHKVTLDKLLTKNLVECENL